jgi:energy-converting hydrogenase Eha subunit A
MRKLFARREPAPRQVPDLSGEPEASRNPVRTPLAATAGHRHLLATRDGVWAYYLMGAVDWPNRKRGDRAAILTDATQRWSELVGHRVWIRGTSNPYPHQLWAQRLDQESTDRRPADIEGARSFGDYLAAGQRGMVSLGARRSVTVLGVRLGSFVVTEAEKLALLLNGDPLPERLGELELLRRRLREITSSVARPGFEARPLSARALGWLIHASVGMGTPVPTGLLESSTDGWVPQDMPGFTAPVYATAAPYAPTTVVRSLRASRQYERHVAVLHADRIDARDPLDPATIPWLAHPHGLDQAVEYVAVLDILDGHDVKSEAQLERRRAKNIAEHYREHDDDPPAEVERGIQGAKRVEDEVNNGTREIAARARGVIMYAVTAPTEEQALDRANELTTSTARDVKIALAHDYGQYTSYRSFIPGEPALMTGHVTQMPCYTLATAVPNTTTAAGDASGFFVGPIGGGHDVLVLDPHGGPRNDTSGMALIGADQGGGKSTLAGALADFEATMGRRVIVYDPSGPLASLTALGHLARCSRHIELASAQPGVLNPYLLVPPPRRAQFATEAEHTQAVSETDAERRELMMDAAIMLMPPRMITADVSGSIAGSIEDAVNHVGGGYGTDPWQVLAHLDTMGEVGRTVADRLRSAASMKSGRLIFPPGDVVDLHQTMFDEHLTVITMRGLSLPPKDQPNREFWSRSQLMSVPVLHLGSRLAARAMYADQDPKAILVDEGGIITGGYGSFAPFMVRASFDSRKNNAFVALLFQNPNTVINLDPQIANLSGMAAIGRMGDEETARAALPLLRLPQDSGYHQLITTLHPGEFVVRDWRGRVRTVAVDRSWWSTDLVEALNTTPGGLSAVESEGADLWSA